MALFAGVFHHFQPDLGVEGWRESLYIGIIFGLVAWGIFSLIQRPSLIEDQDPEDNRGHSYEPMPKNEQVFPADGILYAPEFPDSLFEVRTQVDSGFVVCRFLIEEGGKLTAGLPFTEFETDKAIVEHEAPCDAIVERFLIKDGDAVVANQPLVRIRKP